MATVMDGVLLLVYVPTSFWAFAFGGDPNVFYAVWAVAVVTTVGMSIAGLIRTIRAPVRELPTFPQHPAY